MKKLLKKKAFTLAEVIIAMGVSTLLIAAAMAMFTPVQNIVNSLVGQSNVTTTADTITSYIYERMHRAVTYNADSYSDVELIAAVDNSDSAAYRVRGMLNDVENPTIESVYCIIIKNTTAGHRIYDLGKISTVADFTNKLANVNGGNNDYKLFSDDYYNGVDYNFTFETTPHDSLSNVKKWCHIGVVPLDSEGEAIVTIRNKVFKLVNMELNNITPYSAAKLTDINNDDYDADETIMVVYRIKDYSKL